MDDRPYSSSLFIGYNQLYRLEKSENLYEYRLDYFGLRIMDRLQTAIHLAMDTTDGRPVPFGWDHQIADYKHTNALGAIMSNFRFTHARFFNQNEDCCFRTYWKAGGSIGTQIYGHGLVGVRIGTSQNGLFSYGNVPISTFTQTRQSDYKDFYMTLEGSVNAWGYNGFLQGIRPGGNDSHRLTFAEVTKLTSLLEFGVHRTYKSTYFNYKLSRRSKEFNLDEARPQWWGAVTVGFRFCD